jgi:lipopolysaccharide export system ATP-binding protein
MADDGPAVTRLTLRGLLKSYGKRTVVDRVDLTVASGEVVALMGRNGAGKTTVLRIAAGLLSQDAGSITLRIRGREHDMRCVPIEQRGRMGLAYLSQRGSLFAGLSVFENLVATLEMLESQTGAAISRSAESHMQWLRISHLAHLRPGQLSFGQRRLAGLARVLIGSPAVLILDEPFAGLDPLTIAHIKAIVSSLRDRGVATIASDHNARELSEIADRVYILLDGRVELEGSMADMYDNPRAKQLYFANSLPSGNAATRI